MQSIIALSTMYTLSITSYPFFYTHYIIIIINIHTSILLASIFLQGAIIQSTLDDEQSKTHAAALSDLSGKASYIVGMLNPDDELTFLRIRSKQREIMVCGIAMRWFC